MKKQLTPRQVLIRQTIFTAAAGLVIAILVAALRGASLTAEKNQLVGALSDGCFVSAVILLGIGMLSVISSIGFFDGVRFGLHKLRQLLPFVAAHEDPVSYYDFKQKRQEKRGSPLKVFLWVGLGFLLFAFLFLSFYA